MKTDIDIETAREAFQQIADKHKAIITVVWNRDKCEAFTPTRNLTPPLPGFDSVSLPKLGEGE